jgi:hypothetical protein
MKRKETVWSNHMITNRFPLLDVEKSERRHGNWWIYRQGSVFLYLYREGRKH